MSYNSVQKISAWYIWSTAYSHHHDIWISELTECIDLEYEKSFSIIEYRNLKFDIFFLIRFIFSSTYYFSIKSDYLLSYPLMILYIIKDIETPFGFDNLFSSL